MTYQFFKRLHQSLKEIELPGVYTCSPTWDDAVAHWYGFYDPMVRSVFTAGHGYEYGDEPTWTENYMDGCCWVTEDETYCYSLDGPCHSIPPTRTPWAAWWRPTGIPTYDRIWLVENSHYFYRLPDIQKDNPQ